MQVRRLAPMRGWEWIVQGFALFRRSPLNWIALCLALVGFALAASLIPPIGELVFYLLSPVLLAGLMVGCRALERGGRLELTCLFEGFRRQTSALVTIGGVYLVGQVLIYGVVILLGGASLEEFMRNVQESTPSSVPQMSGSMMLALAVAAALSVPLLMAVWFAPLLVIFDGLLPFASMRESFNACLANLLPLVVYGSILMVLGFVALLPFALGLIVLVPTVFASIYASYKDIFGSDFGV
ncbi:BPSS1780 family membrane protein [Pelomicrobium methylotrophicum]|uniref:Transmembrane protein n=1 Tax=Pelomicrobium methylotrophicum TaxID=2602750 RepID=A0A5C7F1U9_9PROT|nr:BPSS1780 family membrane protein [Pelomicrobium methylotrophicum]TXF13758.1 hypothetical protein FR698_01225 [Pelomicrobium methylotrophicum]